jgi:hypothetical protein
MKQVEPSHSAGQTLKTESVFEILGEGGGISIVRQKNEISEKFIYHHNEFDPTEEGLGINKKYEYDNFEQPFQLINDRYSWFMLHFETIHEDYRNYIIDRLIEKLNAKSVAPNYLANKKVNLEYALKIKLNYNLNQQTNSFIWSCEKIN